MVGKNVMRGARAMAGGFCVGLAGLADKLYDSLSYACGWPKCEGTSGPHVLAISMGWSVATSQPQLARSTASHELRILIQNMNASESSRSSVQVAGQHSTAPSTQVSDPCIMFDAMCKERFQMRCIETQVQATRIIQKYSPDPTKSQRVSVCGRRKKGTRRMSCMYARAHSI